MDEYFKNIKRYIKSFDYNFLIFLFLATVLWLSLQFSKTNIQTYNIGLNYIIPDQKLLDQQADQRIIVKLKSKTWNLLNINKFEEKIDIRLQDRSSQILSEAALYNLVKEKVKSKYEIVSIIPSSININLLEAKSKMIPVNLKGSIDVKPGYSLLNDIQIIPDSIRIFGSEEDIREINAWYIDKPVGPNLDKDMDQLVNLEVLEITNSISIAPSQVRLQFQIDQMAEQSFKKKIIPETMDSLYSIPSYALIKLAIPLRNLEKVSASDLNIILEPINAIDSTEEYFLRIKSIPSNSKLLTLEPTKVTVYKKI